MQDKEASRTRLKDVTSKTKSCLFTNKGRLFENKGRISSSRAAEVSKTQS